MARRKNPYGILNGTKVIVASEDVKSSLKSRDFGEERDTRLELSLFEALFLVESKNFDVISFEKSGKQKKLNFEDILKAASSEENFYSKYKVYKDLKMRGLVTKTGFKFGADFRVYERGATVKKDHSTSLVHVVPEEYTCSFPELVRAVRLSGNVNKNMVFAVVDGEGDISYYRIDRIRF